MINQKSVLLGIVVYSSLSTDQLQQLDDNFNRAKARAVQKSDKEDVDVDMFMPSRIVAFGQVFPIMVNYRAGRNARRISNQPNDIVPITAQGMTFLFNTMHKKEVKD